MKDLTKEEWERLLEKDKNAFVLDVRTDEEFEEGHLRDATQIDIYQGAEFLEALEKLDKSKNYYVYCRAGGRSKQACQLMDQMGFGKTYNLLGGYDGIKQN